MKIVLLIAPGGATARLRVPRLGVGDVVEVDDGDLVAGAAQHALRVHGGLAGKHGHNCKMCKTAFCGATIEDVSLHFVWKRNVSIPLSHPLQLYPNFPVSSRSCSFTLGSIYSRWQCSGNHILKLVSCGVEAMVS